MNNNTEIVSKQKEKLYKTNINEINFKRIKIIKTLSEGELDLLSEKEAISYITNKAIEFYFKSDEIQKEIKNL